jgi:hypothetical protein
VAVALDSDREKSDRHKTVSAFPISVPAFRGGDPLADLTNIFSAKFNVLARGARGTGTAARRASGSVPGEGVWPHA